MARGFTRPRSEILTSFGNEMKAIAASCESYDSGNSWEAQRLATSVYKLVHNSSKNRSFLTHLGIRGSARFLSTYKPSTPGNMAPWMPLVLLKMGSAIEYVPQCSAPGYPDNYHTRPRLVQFHTWWEDEKVLSDPNTLFLNRRRLVCILRNQDDGSHVDEKLTDPAYIRFSRQNNDHWKFAVNGTSVDVEGLHLATMRQIAWEIQQSLVNVK